MKSVIFNDDEVRATLAGTKTMFQRVITGVNGIHSIDRDSDYRWWYWKDNKQHTPVRIKCPFGSVGDTFFVKEAFSDSPDGVIYRATKEDAGILSCGDEDRWQSVVHMPEWAARLRLEIVEIKVERLNDISEADILAEGVTNGDSVWNGSYLNAFAMKWNKRFPKHLWISNPYVWCVRYKKD